MQSPPFFLFRENQRAEAKGGKRRQPCMPQGPGSILSEMTARTPTLRLGLSPSPRGAKRHGDKAGGSANRKTMGSRSDRKSRRKGYPPGSGDAPASQKVFRFSLFTTDAIAECHRVHLYGRGARKPSGKTSVAKLKRTVASNLNSTDKRTIQIKKWVYSTYSGRKTPVKPNGPLWRMGWRRAAKGSFPRFPGP